MERDDRAPVATFYVQQPVAAARFATDDVVTLGAGEAHHARVKRLAAGDEVRLTDGVGALATGTIESISKSSVLVAVTASELVAPPSAIHLRVPMADRDRMLWLAEKATELGITSWQAVRFRRSASVTPRGEGPGFAEKVRARMISALEQSGGAWLPEVLPDCEPDTVDLCGGHVTIVLDITGAPLSSVLSLDGARDPVILFGPEGGIDLDEASALRAAGWLQARLATTTLRFETAGIAAVAVTRSTYPLSED